MSSWPEPKSPGEILSNFDKVLTDVYFLLERAGMIRCEGEESTISDSESLEGTTCSCSWVARRLSPKVLEPSNVDV